MSRKGTLMISCVALSGRTDHILWPNWLKIEINLKYPWTVCLNFDSHYCLVLIRMVTKSQIWLQIYLMENVFSGTDHRLLQHKGRKWCSIPLDFRADLILKSAEMTNIDRISLVLLSIHINWEGETNVLPISVISADLRINSARKSSGMEHHLRPMCFKTIFWFSGEPGAGDLSKLSTK